MKVDGTGVYWDIGNLKEIKKPLEAVAEFEAFFFRTFLKEARKSIPEGLFNSSFTSKFYFDMLDMQISEVVAKQDPLKLKVVFEEAIKRYTSLSEGER
ncbi:MAG: rod-binding protein [Desulfurobacteriaceae bacterium]